MMSFITGYITAIATFPGVIVQQAARQLACYFLAIPVFKVVYFQPWPPFGLVLREPSSSPWTETALVIGPAMVNTLLGLAIGSPAVFSLFTCDDIVAISLVDMFLVWLGVSIAAHSFPTFKDAELVMNSVTAGPSDRWVGAPLSSIMYLGAIASIFWVDVIYAVIVVVGIPILLLEILRMAY